ncbi:MAG: hypothetical protein ABIZ72_04685, partial [Candidatus Limnocylindrales bacterium]
MAPTPHRRSILIPLLAAALSACSGTAAPATGAPSAAPTAAGSASAATSEAPSAVASASGSVVWWVPSPDSIPGTSEQIAAHCSETTGIHVDLQLTPWD